MRKGFTLIELIFVIVIIGVLAAVAVPKFTSLKENAQVNNLVKMIKDAESSVPSAAVNFSDLENNTTYKLGDILNLSGNQITYDGSATYGKYIIEEPTGSGQDIGRIDFNRKDRTLTTMILCDGFKDTKSQDKCKSKFNEDNDNFDGSTYTNTITF